MRHCWRDCSANFLFFFLIFFFKIVYGTKKFTFFNGHIVVIDRRVISMVDQDDVKKVVNLFSFMTFFHFLFFNGSMFVL